LLRHSKEPLQNIRLEKILLLPFFRKEKMYGLLQHCICLSFFYKKKNLVEKDTFFILKNNF